MKILIVCESRKAFFVIRLLKERNHNITLISAKNEICRMMSDTFEIMSVTGDAACTSVLEDAGIKGMDLVMTLCESDAENLVVCELAKKKYNIKKTISLVNNPDNVSFFLQNGVDHCINEPDLFASIVTKESAGDSIMKFMPSGNPNFIVKEAVLSAKSKVLNKKIWEIPFAQQSLVTCILRNGRVVVPHGNTECREGDRLIVLAAEDVMDDTLSLFSGT